MDRIKNGDKPLRFDSYWVCVPDWTDSDPEYYQVGYTVTDRQITIITFTPPEPERAIPDAADRVPEGVFFVKHDRGAVKGLLKLDSWVVAGQRIAHYQVERLHNEANKERPMRAARKRAARRRSRSR